MHLTLVPILQKLREVYDIEEATARFNAYVAMAFGKDSEPLPIGMFSPMGKRQPDYLDALLAMDAERIAAETAERVAAELTMLPDKYRLIVVPVDEPRNGWTERNLSDADWRFSTEPNELGEEDSAPWITVQVWTDVPPTETYITRETRAVIFRSAYQRRYGLPKRLSEMMAQEGHCLAFAGYAPTLSDRDIAAARKLINDFANSEDYPVCFSALYGDEAAKSVGYTPLGLPPKAGFDVALSNALELGDHIGILASRSTNALKGS